MLTNSKCPCGTDQAFDVCCGPFLNGTKSATTAEQLMRSRYSAFATGKVDYLMETWHPSTRPSSLEMESDLVWTQLAVHSTTGGGALDTVATVEFTAHFRVLANVGNVHENSSFERHQGKWLYVAGIK